MNTKPIDRMDRLATDFIAEYSLALMRWSLVSVLVWSGLLAIAGLSSEATLVVEAIGAPVGIGIVALGV